MKLQPYFQNLPAKPCGVNTINQRNTDIPGEPTDFANKNQVGGAGSLPPILQKSQNCVATNY